MTHDELISKLQQIRLTARIAATLEMTNIPRSFAHGYVWVRLDDAASVMGGLALPLVAALEEARDYLCGLPAGGHERAGRVLAIVKAALEQAKE